MLKQLGLLTGRRSRRTKNTNPVSETAAVTATATAKEEAAAENDCSKSKEEEAALGRAAPQTVSVVSKEQAMQLLKPDQAAATRKRSGSKSTSATATATVTTTPTHEGADGNSKSSIVPPEAEAETGAKVGHSSLEGKFVNLVDLLLPVPSKGEFDVNKIKSSLYFFS